jgi:hypothetical protein
MSIAPVASRRTSPVAAPDDRTAPGVPGGEQRLRHQARDAVTVMLFSAATSAGIALFFLLLAVAARQA